MTDILKEILQDMPDNAEISDSVFEGANIVLYTKSKDFFLDSNGAIKRVVDKIKKRVELRPDKGLCTDQEEAENTIKRLVPKEAGQTNVIFDPQRSSVIIEVEKPGLAIGKSGEILKEIKKQTFWVPTIRRIPMLRSKLIEKIRTVLYENNDYRKKFLNKIGERIYEGWEKGKKEEWIRVSFLGASRQVGRSSFLLQTPESKVLLDCGIDVSASEENAYPFLEIPEFKLEELDAIILTHSHVDHCGFIPYLYKMGYKGPTYCTEPTRDVAALLCLDIINIAQKEGKKALYGSADIKEMVKHTITLDMEEVSDITPDLRITFYNSGHILGAAMVHIHIGNGLHNLLYTGDMNYEDSNTLEAAATIFPRLETVIMEATYGGKDDNTRTRKEAEEEMFKLIKATIERGGKVLMPVLGVGRAQEVMLIVEKAIREGKLEKIPVYLQGMVWDATSIYTAYPDYFNPIVKKMIFHKDQNPFLSDVFKHIGSQAEMKEVIEGGPCIVMATSGMMTGGASVEYFKHFADSNRNTLIQTCYQGPGSLGRRLQNGEKEINMGTNTRPEMVKVNMDVHSIQGLSGHSTREQTLEFIRKLQPKPKKIILVHGESSKCLDLASTIHKTMRIETSAPKNLEALRIR